MSKSKDTQKTFPNTGRPKSGRKLASSRNATDKLGEVEIVQPKQGTWQTYDATNGLPGGVWCLLQDRRSFLWLGTEVGLCRYDGMEFIIYTTPDGLAHNYVYAICEDQQG